MNVTVTKAVGVFAMVAFAFACAHAADRDPLQWGSAMASMLLFFIWLSLVASKLIARIIATGNGIISVGC